MLRYLKFSKDFILKYVKNHEPIKFFSDSNLGKNKIDRKSISDVEATSGKGPIIWLVRKQSCVADSTGVADYYAIFEAVKEIKWALIFLFELGVEKYAPEPYSLFADDETATSMSKTWEVIEKIKHVDLKNCYIKDMSQKGKVNLKCVPSKENPAGLITEPLNGARTKFSVTLSM